MYFFSLSRHILVALFCATLSLVLMATETNASLVEQQNSNSTKNAGSEDIAAWKHPAKKIFANSGVTLKRYLIQGNTAQFEVAFSYDPQTSPNNRRVNQLCARLLQADHWTNVSIVSQDDQINIVAKYENNSKHIAIDFMPLK
jgi:hypothetical protein